MSDRPVLRPKNFFWANHPKAKKKEPIKQLQITGWSYGDIPTASNFNWIFNEISKWNEFLYARTTSQEAYIQNLDGELKSLKRDLNTVIDVLSGVVNVIQKEHPPFIHIKLPDINE